MKAVIQGIYHSLRQKRKIPHHIQCSTGKQGDGFAVCLHKSQCDNAYKKSNQYDADNNDNSHSLSSILHTTIHKQRKAPPSLGCSNPKPYVSYEKVW